MDKEILQKIKNAQRDKAKNTQMVFDRLPGAQTKERKKVSFDALFEKHALSICPEYQMNDSLITMKNYFEQVEKFDTGAVINTPNLFKGLFVYGPVGTGKSLFFEIMQAMGKELVMQYGYQGLWFSKVTAPWMVEEYMRSADKNYSGNFEFTSYYKGKLYIDDLGAESMAFGRDEKMTDLLFQRHANGAMTYVTTNLTPKEITLRYGARIGDRLEEYFNIIKLGGKSKRKS